MADKILVVDDEDKIRAVIRKYGEFEGFEIYEASNGMDAVEMCRENDYDLIIMDVMMPELDGFSACGAIKKIKDIPVIMLSARGEEYDRIHGFEVGVDDLVEPFVVNRRNKSISSYFDVYFIVKKYKGEIKINEPEKCSELVWADPYDLPEDMIDFEKEALEYNEMGVKFSTTYADNEVKLVKKM